jgi:RNA-binding protein YlmH
MRHIQQIEISERFHTVASCVVGDPNLLGRGVVRQRTGDLLHDGTYCFFIAGDSSRVRNHNVGE